VHDDELFFPSSKPVLEFDPKIYAHHVASLDLSDKERDALIRAVANIMLAFVDLGFGIGPSQTACGQDGVLSDLIPKAAPDLLYCEHSKPAETLAATGRIACAEQEES